MTSRTPRLALFDLDGTLLTSKRTILEDNVRALRRLMDAGVLVAFCTGRPPGSAQRYVDVVRPNAPLIHFNGAVVRDAADGRVIFSRSVPADTALAALVAADGHARHANIYVGDAIWIERRSETSRVSEEKDGVAHTVVPDLRGRLSAGGGALTGGARSSAGDVRPTKVMLIADAPRVPAMTAAVSASVGDGAALVNSEPEYLEVLPRGVSKKTAAEALCGHLGLTLNDVVAFGDNLNDLDLLVACGRGVAMSNSHPEVLARVSAHIGDNDSDAIARFLDELFA